MEGFLLLISTCGELSVLCGVGSSQGFPRAGSAVWPAAGHVHQHRAAMGGQRGAAQGPRFLPLLSPQPWNFIQMDLTPSLNSPVHTSLVRVFLWEERTESRGGGGRRAACSIPAKATRARCYAPGSRFGMQLWGPTAHPSDGERTCAPQVSSTSSDCWRGEKTEHKGCSSSPGLQLLEKGI